MCCRQHHHCLSALCLQQGRQACAGYSEVYTCAVCSSNQNQGLMMSNATFYTIPKAHSHQAGMWWLAAKPHLATMSSCPLHMQNACKPQCMRCQLYSVQQLAILLRPSFWTADGAKTAKFQQVATSLQSANPATWCMCVCCQGCEHCHMLHNTRNCSCGLLQVPHLRSSCSCRSTPLIMMGLLLCSSWRFLMLSCLKPTCTGN